MKNGTRTTPPRVWLLAVIMSVTVAACGLDPVTEYEDREIVGLSELELSCGWNGVVTSFIHLPGVFDTSDRVIETVEPELELAGDQTYDLTAVVDAGGIWLFVTDDDYVFGAAEKATGTITYCLED